MAFVSQGCWFCRSIGGLCVSNHLEIFDNMLFALNQFAKSQKSLCTKEIAHRLNIHIRTSQRITKALREAGWLDFELRGSTKLYFATEKAKRLFGDQ